MSIRFLRSGIWLLNTFMAVMSIAWILTGSVFASEPGIFGKCIQLESSSPYSWLEAEFRDEYYRLPITIEGWVKLEPDSGPSILLSAGLREYPGHWEISSSTSSDALSSSPLDTNGIPSFDHSLLSDGQWHYIATIIEKNRVRLYVDALLVSDTPYQAVSSDMIAARFASPTSIGNLAFIGNGVKPAIADSEMALEIHRARNLNDGKYGNNNSWISTQVESTFTIDLGASREFNLFRLGRDRLKQISDRPLVSIKIETSMDAQAWQNRFEMTGVNSLSDYSPNMTMEIQVPPVQAQYIRVTIGSKDEVGRYACVDEFEVYHLKDASLPREDLPKVTFYAPFWMDAQFKGPLYWGDYPRLKQGCDGLLDEIRISKIARTIQAIPKTPFVPDRDTIGLWHFDDKGEKGGFKDSSSLKNSALICPPRSSLKLKLKRGMTLDRQYHSLPDEPNISESDVRLIKTMGFEFVKHVANPAIYKSGDGLILENMAFLDSVIDRAAQEHLPMVLCIHPEPDFKRTVFSGSKEFADLLGFYEAFAGYLAKRWNPDQLAFQLMTEPFGNICDWNIIQLQMWKAVRRAMPDHTLILSGDQVSSIDGLSQVIPVNDSNVLYCFTFYEPYLFTLQGAKWSDGWLPYLQAVPYPSSPEIISEQLPEILDNIPASPTDLRSRAAPALNDYGKERWNRDQLRERIKKAEDWNGSYGGHLAVWCAESGVLTGAASPEDRLAYIKDLFDIYQSYDIGWAYWSYNETFTVLNKERTKPEKELLDILLGDEPYYGHSFLAFRPPLTWGVATTKNHTLYLHVYSWPDEGFLPLPGLANKIQGGSLCLSADKRIPIQVKQIEKGVKIMFKKEPPIQRPLILALDLDDTPKVSRNRFVVRPLADGALVFNASESETHGRLIHVEQLELHGGNIGWWNELDDSATWNLKMERPGIYNIDMCYACSPGYEGSKFEIAIGREKMIASILSPSSSWADYQVVPLGSMDLNETGELTLRLKPVEIVNAVLMNLRWIRFRPAGMDEGK